jgi:hypothetical protein
MSLRGGRAHTLADFRFASARAEEARLAAQRSLVKDVTQRQFESTWLNKNDDAVRRMTERERCVAPTSAGPLLAAGPLLTDTCAAALHRLAAEKAAAEADLKARRQRCVLPHACACAASKAYTGETTGSLRSLQPRQPRTRRS